MELVANRPNVELRHGRRRRSRSSCSRSPTTRTSSPSSATIPHRRFDWDTREWWAPVDDWAGVHVAEVLDALPRADADRRGRRWLAGIERRWVGRVGAARHDGRGWCVAATRAPGRCPRRCSTAPSSDERRPARPAHRARPRRRCASRRSARLDAGRRALRLVAGPRRRPAARAPGGGPAASTASACGSRCCGTATPARRSTALPGRERQRRALPLDPWIVEQLDAFIALHDVEVDGRRGAVLARAARRARRGGRARSAARAPTDAEPIAEAAAVLGGELAAVPVGGRALRARRAPRVPRRRAGARQDGRGAGRARGRRRLPGDRRLPRVAEAQLGARGRALAAAPHRRRGRAAARAVPPRGDITILNYEIVAAHREALGAARARARSSSTSRTTARTRAPSAPRPCAGWRRDRRAPTACGWR